MTFQLKKMAAGVALALAVGLPTLDAQAAIQFNNLQGTGTGVVESFTVTSGNFLFQGITPSATGAGDDGAGNTCLVNQTVATCASSSAPTRLYGQSVISTFNLVGSGGLSATAGVNEYTIVMNIPLLTYIQGSPVTLSAILNTAASDAGFFEIWAGASNSNAHAGTGFRDGTMILSGTVSSLDVLGLSNSTPLVRRPLDNRSTASVSSSPPREYTTTNVDADGFPVASIVTSGSTTVTVDVTGGSALYFPTLPLTILAGFDINPFTPTLTSPFGTVAPTRSFADLGGPAAIDFGNDSEVIAPIGPGATVNPLAIYQLNNFNCGTDATCGFMAEGAAQGSIDAATIPEPGVLALFGIGLAGLGMFGIGRRRTV